ncbi:hypothetical protein [Planotetraspora sp. GP83]|uniref:hypothetical protein n=1 Tax=Planotetraspora sp. GP83 TaxID=3156264 RepID=UPI0035146B8E
MNAVYGDFLRQASDHMQTAAYCAERGVTGRAAIATLDPAQRMTKVMLRYLHELTPRGARSHGGHLLLWDRVNDPRVLLQEAERILHRLSQQVAGQSRNGGDAVPTHVAAAALAMGTGHDLLKTHYAPRSDWANAIDHQDVRRALVYEVARQAQLLGIVMDRARNELRRADLPSVALERLVTTLRDSGGAAGWPIPPWASATLAAVPLRAAQAPAPIRTTSSVEEICTGIIADAEGIRATPSRGWSALSATQCERNAAAAAVILHCAYDVVTLLVRRHVELFPSSELLLRQKLRKSAEGLDRVSQRWQAVRRGWKRLTTERQPLTVTAP